MAQQKQQIPEVSKPFALRVHMLAYIGVFILLYIEGNKLANTPVRVVGILFVVAAFLILLGQLPVVALRKVARFVDSVFTFPMYIVGILVFISGVLDLVESTGQVELLWSIPVVLIGILVYDTINMIKGAGESARLIGKKETAIKWLKDLTFVILFFVLFVLAFDVQGIGRPVLWLIPAIVSLTIALFLDGTFKK